MISIQGLDYSIEDNKILKNISFVVPEHSVTVLIGPNGAGKTTTLELLAGIRKSENVTLRLAREKYKIVYVDPSYLIFEELTAQEFIKFIANINDLGNEKVDQILRDFKNMNIDGFLAVKLKDLSRGEKQKLAILTGFLSNANVLLFDEPFNGLDFKSAKHFKQVLNTYKRFFTILLTTHSLHDIETYADSCIFLSEGRVVSQIFNREGGDSFEFKQFIRSYQQE